MYKLPRTYDTKYFSNIIILPSAFVESGVVVFIPPSLESDARVVRPHLHPGIDGAHSPSVSC